MDDPAGGKKLGLFLIKARQVNHAANGMRLELFPISLVQWNVNKHQHFKEAFVKKILAYILMMMLFSGMAPMARAEAASATRLEGVITEVWEDGTFLMDSISIGTVLVHVNAQTVLEGLVIPAPGQYVFVSYSGTMTKSIPPQVTAQAVSRYMFAGTVQEVDEADGTALVESEDCGLVMVHLPQMEAILQEGDFVAVYFSGVMALSYPAQAGGLKVDVYAKVSGAITEIGEGYFLLEGEAGSIRVNTGEDTALPEALEVGDEVVVYSLGGIAESMPAQVMGAFVFHRGDE